MNDLDNQLICEAYLKKSFTDKLYTHAKNKGYNILPIYRGEESNRDIKIFDRITWFTDVDNPHNALMRNDIYKTYCLYGDNILNQEVDYYEFTELAKEFDNRYNKAKDGALKTIVLKGSLPLYVSLRKSAKHYETLEHDFIYLCMEKGYDLIRRFDSYDNDYTIVATSPQQIKILGDTYDDNNNLIPLEQRFDKNNKDCRY